MNEKIANQIRRRARMKPAYYRWMIESAAASKARWLGYYVRRVENLSHPYPDGPMVGTCPICWERAFELDPLANLWECLRCGSGGNHWALEALLSPGEEWGACAERADRLVWAAWKEGDREQQ